MKQTIISIILGATALSLTSCDNYIDLLPKGTQIPETVEDFEPLLYNESSCCMLPSTQALYLLNDLFVSRSNLSNPDLRRANYMWDESADRVDLNNNTELTFDKGYQGISVYNVIINNVPAATGDEQRKKTLVGYARVLRAFNYLSLVNFYADQYEESTAATKLGVPVIFDDNIEGAHTQKTVGEIYDFIISEINEVLADGVLPEVGESVLHPGIATSNAILARTYLSMGKYAEAKACAEKALAVNSDLYDWNEIYELNKEKVDDPKDMAVTIPSPIDRSYCENFLFRHGERITRVVSNQNEFNISLDRYARFEVDDVMAKVRWKQYTSGGDLYMRGQLNGFYNDAGLTVTEMVLIKAECMAREGKTAEAMAQVNEVRKHHILASSYQPIGASDLADAIDKIYTVKANALIGSIVPFMDARRLNAEGKYPRMLTKTVSGESYTLSPTSHLWTMVFPSAAINNPGNGSFVQNSK